MKITTTTTKNQIELQNESLKVNNKVEKQRSLQAPDPVWEQLLSGPRPEPTLTPFKAPDVPGTAETPPPRKPPHS